MFTKSDGFRLRPDEVVDELVLVGVGDEPTEVVVMLWVSERA
jgi:hypothetical protein